MKNMIWIVAFTLFISSCGTTEEMKKEEVVSNNPIISELKKEITKAKKNDMEVKAPTTFRRVEEKYRNAIEMAREEGENGAPVAKEGLELLEKAKAKEKVSEQVLEQAYTHRRKALEANAQKHYPERTKEMEEELKEASAYVEEGEIEDARDKQDEIISAYSRLEVDSLKKGVTAEAQRAFDEAVSAGADDYAPKSLSVARDALQYAKEILESDRTEVGQARNQARRAKYLAERAKHVAMLAKSFDGRDLTNEEIVLWYHENLNKIASVLNKKISYNRENDQIINALTTEVSQLKSAVSQKQRMSRMREQRIDQLKMRYSAVLKKGERGKFREPQSEDRFQAVNELFTQEEARVYRSGNDVIIKAHGFDFPVGFSRIEVQNYPLVTKLIEAVYFFPDAERIVIAGHTDSSGSASLNMKLSKQRAENLKKLFATIGKIPKGKLETKGYGEERPVESNRTAKGRNLNRRIEVKILNP